MRTVTVTSPLAGVGKTMVATQLAYELAVAGARTCLIDLDEKGDASFATVQALQDLAGRGAPVHIPRSTASSWLFTRENVDVAPAPETLLTLVPADVAGEALTRLEHDEAAHEQHVDRFRAFLAVHADRFDAVVIDTPSARDVRVLAALRASTHAVMVATPDDGSLRAIGQFLTERRTGIDTLRATGDCGIGEARVVWNRSALGPEQESAFVEEVGDRRPELWVRDDHGRAPFIPEHPVIDRARRDGTSIGSAWRASPTGADLVELLRRTFTPIMGDLLL